MRPALIALPILLLMLGSASGCPSEPKPEPEPRSLAKPDAWVRVSDETQDLFAAERPADATCDDAGYYFEPITQALEVQTELCNYVTLRQPTLEPLEPGDQIRVQGYHGDLTAPEPSEGYLGLAIAGELAWELSVPIPSAAAEFDQTFTCDRSLPAGVELQLHVHNHGANSWDLIALEVTPTSG